MNNKFFMTYVDNENIKPSTYLNKEDSEYEAQRLVNELSEEVFIMECISSLSPEKVNIEINSYEDALEYLGKSSIHVTLSDFRMIGILNEHVKSLNALNILFTIAEAWNKADGFVPEISIHNQCKWYPWLIYNTDLERFVYEESIYYTDINVCSSINSRICFKTKERATQFGKQFIELWNDFLLF